MATTWLDHHRAYEFERDEAQRYLAAGDLASYRHHYLAAAAAEGRALKALDCRGKARTYGITLVSQAACLVKGGDVEGAKALAREHMGVQYLPDFAKRQLEQVLAA